MNKNLIDSLIIKTLGDSPKLRIIDFLLDNRVNDYSKKQIIEGSNISKVTFQKYWKELENSGMVKITRRFGKTKLFALNEQNEIVQKLLNLELLLIQKSAEANNKIKTEPEKQLVTMA